MPTLKISSGLLLIVVAGVLVGGAVATLADAGSHVSEQCDALVTTLRATSQTLGDASTGVGGVGQSLTAAKTSSEKATELAGSLGSTLRGLSSAMHVNVFGTQPLAGLSSGFDAAASQSEELATDLGAVSAALGANGADLDTTRQDLVMLQGRVDALIRSLEGTSLGATDPGSGTVPTVVIEAAFLALLAWLAVPAAVALAVGIGLLRGALR